jgi:hypothetical protein
MPDSYLIIDYQEYENVYNRLSGGEWEQDFYLDPNRTDLEEQYPLTNYNDRLFTFCVSGSQNFISNFNILKSYRKINNKFETKLINHFNKVFFDVKTPFKDKELFN